MSKNIYFILSLSASLHTFSKITEVSFDFSLITSIFSFSTAALSVSITFLRSYKSYSSLNSIAPSKFLGIMSFNLSFKNFPTSHGSSFSLGRFKLKGKCSRNSCMSCLLKDFIPFNGSNVKKTYHVLLPEVI